MHADYPTKGVNIPRRSTLTPGWSPPYTISQRLKELGYPNKVFKDETLLQTIRLVMSDVNLEGRHARFETVDEIARLVEDAKERCARAFPCLNESRGIHRPSIL